MILLKFSLRSRFLAIPFVLFCACTQTSNESSVIDLANFEEDALNLTLSEFIGDIEYIPLETSAQCILGQQIQYTLTDSLLLAGNSKGNLHMFDLQGRYLGDLVQWGKGPDEYLILTDIYWDPVNREVIVFDGMSKKLRYYNMQGKQAKEVKVPFSSLNVNRYDNDFFIANNFVQKSDSFGCFSHYHFDQTGCIKPLFYEACDERNQTVMGTSSFFEVGNMTGYKTAFGDTLFLFKEGIMSNKVFIDMGQYRLPSNLIYDQNAMIDQMSQYYFPVMFFAAYGNQFFVRYYYHNEPVIHVVDLDSYQVHLVKQNPDRTGGIINDIDGGPYYSYGFQTTKSTFYKLISSSKFCELRDEGSIRKAQVIDSDQKDVLITMSQQLSETDNPILMILKRN